MKTLTNILAGLGALVVLIAAVLVLFLASAVKLILNVIPRYPE